MRYPFIQGWSDVDAAAAEREGWIIYPEWPASPLSIRAVAAGPFEFDTDAKIYVMERAKNGSALHNIACDIIRQQSPKIWEEMQLLPSARTRARCTLFLTLLAGALMGLFFVAAVAEKPIGPGHIAIIIGAAILSYVISRKGAGL